MYKYEFESKFKIGDKVKAKVFYFSPYSVIEISSKIIIGIIDCIIIHFLDDEIWAEYNIAYNNGEDDVTVTEKDIIEVIGD